MAKILPIRISTGTQPGDTLVAVQAIEWAIDHNAKVICYANTGGSAPELLDVVNRAIAENIVVVAAVGNRPESTGVGAPASFPGVLAVGAVDKTGTHYSNSVTGPELVLSAPGTDIVSADKGGGYSIGNGTSGATAIVAGAVALVRAKYPDLPADEVVHRLTATATDKGAPGRDNEYGYGVLNLVAALTADVPPLRSTVTSSAVEPTPAPTISQLPAGAGTGGTIVFLVFATLIVGGIVLIFLRKRRLASRE